MEVYISKVSILKNKRITKKQFEMPKIKSLKLMIY